MDPPTMRELIYLSNAKLRQFRRERPGKWRRVREVGAKAPFVEVTVSLSDEATVGVPDLGPVLRYLDTDSAQPPRWYMENGLEPGQWIQFEALMNYDILTDAPGQPDSGMLVFWDVSLTGEPDLVRLMLHGSPGHLVDAEVNEQPNNRFGKSTAYHFLHALNHLLSSTEAPDQPPAFRLAKLLSTLDQVPPETASWVAGYARVTAIQNGEPPRVVVASPLYVEYSR
jgi:hypothetical protein